jgi:hypothetical protein
MPMPPGMAPYQPIPGSGPVPLIPATSAADAAGILQTGQPVGAPPVPQGPTQLPPEPKPAGPKTTLNLETQKRVRNAIRDFVNALRTLPSENWEQSAAAAIQAEFSIYHYCKDVTIRYALKEAGADDALCDKFFDHPAAKLIPPDVPRG